MQLSRKNVPFVISYSQFKHSMIVIIIARKIPSMRFYLFNRNIPMLFMLAVAIARVFIWCLFSQILLHYLCLCLVYFWDKITKYYMFIAIFVGVNAMKIDLTRSERNVQQRTSKYTDRSYRMVVVTRTNWK